jgi:hypothetical protein
MHDETAQSFLNSQRIRISEIERQVFQSTEHMSRFKSQAITATELAELCRMVQESNLRQMEQLGRLMQAAGCEVPWNDRCAKEAHVVANKNTQFTMVGYPLERVSEGDSETDGSVTPRPTLIKSPFERQYSSQKKFMTSTTPTMDSFTLR